MTTIKLTKKPVNTVATGKAPVRRGDPTLRDRSKAPPKPVIRADNVDEKPRSRNEAPSNRPQRDTKSDYSKSDNTRTDSSRQRNHRFDGKPREASEGQSNRNAGQNFKSDSSRSDFNRPDSGRSESSRLDSNRAEKPKGVDTRTTPRANREEPHYRQAPRRGGKVRDGYDANAPTYGAAAKAAYKSTAVSDDQPRLSKVLAERGLCSRREADEWISNGWVMVNGTIIDTLGTRIDPNAEIVISSYAYETQAENVTIILHKPVGYVSGQAEDGYQPAVVLVHPDNQWEDDPELHKAHPKEFQRRYLQGLAPAGRLDIDSTGMLVLTQDGRVARHLIGENSTVEKEYLVRVEGELIENGMKLLNHGLSLDGEKLKPAKVSWQNEDQLRFVLREGKKRQIRRMCELVGLHVVGLKRVRIGSITLGKLPVGEWRYLRPEEKF